MRSYLLRLLSHAPGHVLRERILDPSRRGSWAERVEGSVLVADFSGFTRLSEALGELGREGALALTDILNRYFRMLVDDIALRRGSELISFGGDGFALLYLGEGHARSALVTAQEIQEAMAMFPVAETPLGEFPLALRIGVDSGSVFHAVAGPTRSPEYLMGGSTVRNAVVGQRICPRGGVTATLRAVEAAGAGVESEPLRDGFVRVRAVAEWPEKVEPADWSTVIDGREEECVALVEPFVDDAVVPLLRAHADTPQLEPEYAEATAVFVQISGLPFDGSGEILPVLGRLGEALAAVLLSLGRPVRKTDVAPDGIKLILLYGPPTGDAAHATTAALTASVVRKGLMPPGRMGTAGGLTLRMGVATGPVYAGEVGSPLRREYTAIGDAMNTAARLSEMAAPWEILATPAVAEAARDTVPAEGAGEMELKGKRAAVPCVRLLEPRLG